MPETSYLRWERGAHTPTDNPAAEIRNGDLQREADLGKGTALESREDASERVAAARRRLDEERLRGSRGYSRDRGFPIVATTRCRAQS